MNRAITRYRVRLLTAGTTALTFLLILLGVYTAAAGAGLACSGQWPLCDGGVLPRSLPSFIEWGHRLVAMITGIAILGTAIGSWLAYDEPKVRLSVATALVATPIQVLLGGATVLQYTPVVQTAHHGTALVIFGGLLAATIWQFEAAPSPGDTDAETEADATAANDAGSSTTGVGRSGD